MRDTEYTISKGSVFDDLGFAPAHKEKAFLASYIKQRMKQLRLNQTSASKRMGIKQPDLSNILRGHFRGYSIERMTRLLGALDCDVDIIIRPHGKNEQSHIIHMGQVPV